MSDASAFAVLPAIDLLGGRVVRLRRGDFADETAYSEAPEEVARGFVEAGATLLHVVDLDAAKTGRRLNAPAIDAILAAVGECAGVEVAGGVRDVSTAADLLGSGAARCVVGTAALGDPSFAERLVSMFGAERIVAAIDVRDGRAVGHGWVQEADGPAASEAIEQLADAGVTTFEVTAIDRDGLLDGPDLPLYDRLVALGRGSIVASGGIASLDDLRAVRDAGCAGAILGRALYEGRLNLGSALRAV